MAVIGNHHDALVAYDKHLHRRRPKGWKKIGEGCTRHAYRSPEGVVYKVDDGGYHNRREHEAFKRYRRWTTLPKNGIFIPPSTLYDVGDSHVLAMPFIEKAQDLMCPRIYSYFETEQKPCKCRPESRIGRMCAADMIRWLELRGMNDMHEENMIQQKDGNVYVIDLGYN